MSKLALSIGKNIKKQRHKRKWSQDKLSKVASIALHTITKIEAGATLTPRIDTLVRIADALSVKVDDLIRS